MAIPLQKYREIIFQMLYSYDIGHPADDDIVELLANELKVTKKIIKEAQQKVHLIQTHLKTIDTLIGKTSKSYDFERIQSVEKNILRLAVYELLKDVTVPPKVAISEALRLSRKFCTKESGSFINAILDAIYKGSIGEQIDTTQIIKTSKDLSLSETIAHEASIESSIVQTPSDE